MRFVAIAALAATFWLSVATLRLMIRDAAPRVRADPARQLERGSRDFTQLQPPPAPRFRPPSHWRYARHRTHDCGGPPAIDP